MLKIIQTLIDSISGQQVDAVFVFAIILSMFLVAGWVALKAIRSHSKGDSDKESVGKQGVSPSFETIIDERLRSMENEIVDKVSIRVASDFKMKIFEETKSIYESISKMREEYAYMCMAKKELESVHRDLDDVRMQMAKLKGQLDVD